MAWRPVVRICLEVYGVFPSDTYWMQSLMRANYALIGWEMSIGMSYSLPFATRLDGLICPYQSIR
eukprot:12430652-Ditylum_brightwellii.AAC.2